MKLLTRIDRWVWLILLTGAVAPTISGQIPAIHDSSESTSLRSDQIEDPLSRTTPRGTIVAFIEAVDREDFVSAARYMQLRGGQRDSSEALARDLEALLDRNFNQALTTISDSSTGALDDGLPIDRERIGPLTIGEEEAYLTLIRVTDPQSGPIWLISSTTLARVPELRALAMPSWIERVMPRPLVSRELFGLSLAHWVVMVASFAIPFILLTLAAGILITVLRWILANSVRRTILELWYGPIRWPLVIALSLAIQLGSLPLFGFPLTFRVAFARVGLVLMVAALSWLLVRLLSLGSSYARSLVRGKQHTSTQSLILLGERLLKASIVLAAVFAILTLLGVDTRTALAGVGIGGVAIALGAQRTVENLLGGIFLLSDKAIAIGDLCRISNHLGWIEDITLRSVRLRTLDNSLVSMPAGVLAQTGIENYATRDKILAQTPLRLRHGTSVGQLRRILADIRQALDENSRIDKATSRIRLVAFGRGAIELELFAYVLTAEVPEFLAIREELLLEIATIVEAAGSGFAMPAHLIYMDERSGVAPSSRLHGTRDPPARSDAPSTQPLAIAPDASRARSNASR